MDFTDDDRFPLFDYGEISITSYSKDEREIALKICMPCCLVQTILPTISSIGTINNYSVKNPIIVWMPTLSSDRFNVALTQQHPRLPNEANNQIKKKLKEVLDLFAEISKVVNSPTDITSMLPLGTYVVFQFRSKIDDIAKILMSLENIELPGVSEFRFALAAALARVLGLIS
jgi:hypothetical protein